MKKILIKGPVLCMSGYSVHSRQIAKWALDLEEKRDDIKVSFFPTNWGINPSIVDPNALNGLIGKMMQRQAQPGEHFDITIQIDLPSAFDPFLGLYNIGVTAAVETDVCNPEWIDAINRMDLTIVPSEFTKKTLTSSGFITKRIEVIPESWFEEIGKTDFENQKTNNKLVEKLKLDTKFNFLLVGQFTGNNAENDRKNIAYTIKWLAEEFKSNEDVGLVIKTNSGRQTKLDKQNCVNMLNQIIMQVKQGKGPKIYLLHGTMTDKEIVDVYTHPSIKAIINLSHGEGFGLPTLEASACGLPVIATNWSAHTEYLNLGKWIKVDCALGPIHPSRVDNKIFMEGSKWAFPEEKDFKRKVRRFYNAPAIPKEWAKELQQKLLKTHSHETISEQYTKILEEILTK